MSQAVGASANLSRRVVLRAMGLIGASVAISSLLPPGRRAAGAQGNLGALQPEEKVEQTLKRLFGDRAITDGSDVVKLDMPLIAENGAVVPITVEVQSPMTPTSHVKTVYIISDKNRRPLNARFTLTPEMGAAVIGTNVRLGETTAVRAVVEMSDGSLLMAKRDVKVTVGGCGG